MSSQELFQHQLRHLYGTDRARNLWNSLLEVERKIVRLNRFSQDFQQLHFLSAVKSEADAVSQVERTSDQLLSSYVMDPASFFVALCVQAQPGEQVLDMCAAPGGKTLVIAEQMFCGTDKTFDEESVLIANELSAPRRERLLKVIQQYIPRDRRQRIYVRGQNGSQYGLKQKETYDRILLDAPCSGERHLLKDPEEFKSWTLKRSQRNQVQQFSLLSSAWFATRPGGTIVYSTCSLEHAENDEVVRKLHHKRPSTIQRIDKSLLSVADQLDLTLEETEFGYSILPDRSKGAGPMYLSLIQKSN